MHISASLVFYQSWEEFGSESTVSTMVLVSKIVVAGIYTNLTQVLRPDQPWENYRVVTSECL